MTSDSTIEQETPEAPPPVFVLTVAPERAATRPSQRALDARLIGEVLLDRYFRTNVAEELWKDSLLRPDDVAVHQELVEGELAPLTFYDKRICYPWELPEWVLDLVLDRLSMEVGWARRRAQGRTDEGEPGRGPFAT